MLLSVRITASLEPDSSLKLTESLSISFKANEVWQTVVLDKSETQEMLNKIYSADDSLIIKFILMYKDGFGNGYSNSFCLNRNMSGSVGISTCPASQIGNRVPPDGTCEKNYK